MASNRPRKRFHFRRKGANQRDDETRAAEFLSLMRREMDKNLLSERYREIQRLKCESLLQGLDINSLPMTVLHLSNPFKDCNCGCVECKKSDEGEDPEEISKMPFGPMTEGEADAQIIRDHFFLPGILTEDVLRTVLIEPDEFDEDTPLIEAVRDGNINVVKAMLNLGAKVNTRGEFGQTPIHTACVIGSIPILELLVSRGGDLKMVNDNQLSALHIAVQQEWPKTTRWLLDRGVDINATDSSGATPLHWAAFEGNVPMVKLLLGRGSKSDIKDAGGRTPFDIARAIRTFNHKAVAGIFRSRTSRNVKAKLNQKKQNMENHSHAN